MAIRRSPINCEFTQRGKRTNRRFLSSLQGGKHDIDTTDLILEAISEWMGEKPGNIRDLHVGPGDKSARNCGKMLPLRVDNPWLGAPGSHYSIRQIVISTSCKPTVGIWVWTARMARILIFWKLVKLSSTEISKYVNCGQCNFHRFNLNMVVACFTSALLQDTHVLE